MYRMQPRAPAREREQQHRGGRGEHASHDEDGAGAAQQRPQTSLDLQMIEGRGHFEDVLPFSSSRRKGAKTPTLLWQQKQFLGCLHPQP